MKYKVQEVNVKRLESYIQLKEKKAKKTDIKNKD